MIDGMKLIVAFVRDLCTFRAPGFNALLAASRSHDCALLAALTLLAVCHVVSLHRVHTRDGHGA